MKGILLDVPTLIVAFALVSVAIGVPLASMTSPRRGTGGLWYWSWGLLAGAAGAALLALRGPIPIVISVMAGNALVIGGIALMGEAVACMIEQRINNRLRWFFTAATPLVLGVLYAAVDSITPRFLYMAAVETCLIAQLAWQLRIASRRAAERHHPAALAFEILLWAFLAETLFRVIGLALFPQQETFFGQTLLSVAFLFGLVFVAIGSCVLIWHELTVKDDAIRYARDTDIDSGLLNRLAFMQLLSASLAAGRKGKAVALIRLRPVELGGGRLDPFEEANLYRNLAVRIESHLALSDVLARFSDDEFIVLFPAGGIKTQAEAVAALLADLRDEQIQADRHRYHVEGAAVLVSCEATDQPSWQLFGLMRSELDGLKAGDIRVMDPAAPPEAPAPA